MSDLLFVMLLAEDPAPGIDNFRMWFIIIVGIVAALSGLFKKKAQDQKKSDQPQPAARPIPRRPAPPLPRPESARRPAPQPAPAVRPLPPEPEAYLFPQPLPEIVARKRTTTRPPMAPVINEVTRLVETETIPIELGMPVQANLVRTRLQALLRERSSLQTGIVLSEILAPPVGLREDPSR